MTSKLLNTLKILVLGIALSFGLSFVYAWAPPTEAPPGGNVSAPINTGSTDQVKSADLVTESFGTNSIRISEGAVAGYVLTSDDEEGRASWQPSSAGGGGTRAPYYQVFDTPGTWTKPSGYGANAVVFSQCWGGGGGGDGRYGGNGGVGGGGGGYVEAQIPLSAYVSATYPVTIGDGGSGGVEPNNSAPAGSGSNTTFAFVTATGGAGGDTSTTNPPPSGASGGLGGGGSISGGYTGVVSTGGRGGNGNFSGGDGIGGDGGDAGGGGGQGGSGGPFAPGVPGNVPGGGGGGLSNPGLTTGGPGADGRCTITVLDGV